MLALISEAPRSCHVATTVCEDTFGFDAGPLLIVLFALAVVGFVVTIVLGARRRSQQLRDDDEASGHDGPTDD
nr:hypothetical protein [uncultured organism]